MEFILFYFYFLTQSGHVDHAGLELLGSTDPSASASQVAVLQVCAVTPSYGAKRFLEFV